MSSCLNTQEGAVISEGQKVKLWALVASREVPASPSVGWPHRDVAALHGVEERLAWGGPLAAIACSSLSRF